MNRVKLGDVADIKLGKMLDAAKNKGVPHPYLANINVRWGSFSLDNLSEMPFEEDETERYSVLPGDLMMCEGGEPGRCAVWDYPRMEMRYQKAVHRIRCSDALNPYWLYYWFFLTGKAGKLDKLFTPTTIKHLVREDLASMEFDLPARAQQDAIVSVIKPIDDKIALNKKLCAELEETAQLIYDYWFTQFDFPDENGNPYRSSGGKMVYNETLKREIPEGWRACCLGDYASNERESVMPVAGVEYEHYSIPAFDDGMAPVYEDGSTIQSNKLVVDSRCLLYSKLNPKFKRLWWPYCSTENPICSTEFIVLKPTDERLFAYCYSVLNSRSFYAHMVHKAVSSTGSRARVDADNATSYLLAVPNDGALIASYSSIAMPLFMRARELREESIEVRCLRDWLLPMLMNGQVKVAAGNGNESHAAQYQAGHHG